MDGFYLAFWLMAFGSVTSALQAVFFRAPIARAVALVFLSLYGYAAYALYRALPL